MNADPLADTSPGPPLARVLLVEDHDLVRATLARYLSESGYDVESVPALADAASVLRRGRPDVIVADLLLLDAAPTETLDWLEQLRGEPPAIVLSAMVDEAVYERARDLGLPIVEKHDWGNCAGGAGKFTLLSAIETELRRARLRRKAAVLRAHADAVATGAAELLSALGRGRRA